jgi:hypothetical protein
MESRNHISKRNPSLGSRLYREEQVVRILPILPAKKGEEQVLHDDGGAPTASGRRLDSPRGANAASLQAAGFTDAGYSWWSTPWRSSSRTPLASASTLLPTPSTPLSLHTRSKPTMVSSPRHPTLSPWSGASTPLS